MKRITLYSMLACLALSLQAAHAVTTISVNMSLSTNDNNSVDADESAVPGLVGAGAVDVTGANWNHIQLRTSGIGAPTVFTGNTQGGSSLALADDAGNASAGSLTSVGSFYSEFSDATDGPNRSVTGEAGLMQSFLNLGSNESITVSGLGSTFTGPGYDVLVFFEIGITTRTYGLELNDGVVPTATFWTNDTLGIDSDVDDDGLMEWVQATGTSLGTATTNANFAVFSDLSGDSFTINGLQAPGGGRAIINGFQIVSHPVPEPATATIAMLGLGGLMMRRRRTAA